MNHWLTPIPHLLESDSTFVIATLWAINGSSPDSIGARVIVTQQSCFGHLQSSHRHDTIVSESRAMLLDRSCQHQRKDYSLGEIAGTPNGFSTVLYEKFSQPYPDWLLCLENALQQSDKVVLNHTVKDDNSNGLATNWEVVLTDPDSCTLDKKAINVVHHDSQTTTLSESVKFHELRVAVIGDSAVALALIEQLKLLPVQTDWLSEQELPGRSSTINCVQCSDHAIDNLSDNTNVAIATTTHELDIHCCYRTMLNQQLSYIGCLGSVRKSNIVKKRLKEMGISEQRLKQLTMPIGLPGITGKQPAIIAASIVAQLLSTQANYFSA